MVGKRTFETPRDRKEGDEYQQNGDLESGIKRRFPKFKDAVELAMAERTTALLKKQLSEGIDTGEYEKYRKSDNELKQIKNKKVREFYSQQNKRIDDWVEVDTIVKAMADEVMDSMNPDADHDGNREREGRLQNVEERVEDMLPDDVQEQRRRASRNARWAININVAANVLLLAGKGVAVLSSDSLSLVASVLDSALDLLCTVIIFTTNKIVSWRLDALKRRFPVGRRRLEPLGVLVFSIIMVISFAQILQESVNKLLPSGDHSVPDLETIAIAVMGGTVILKGIIGLGCIRVKTTQVQALAQDCKTDVIFNSLTLLFPLIGKHANIWWLDSVGAGILSLYIIFDWLETAFENVTRLCGSAVDEALQRKLTFLAWRFANLVSGFKAITAYHAGDGVWVEYDILMTEKTALRRAHDVAETLQYCCEALNEVDRSFVTVDYSVENPIGHATDHS